MVVSQFQGGLDTLDTPAELAPSQAQDLLNVNIQPGGASIFKRDGYGLDQTLLYSTSPTHGLYHFQQTGGSDVRLAGSDVNLYSSVNDASFVKVATGTFGATWQCADSQGSAYCLSSSRDMAVKTDGTSANTTYQNGIPLGTMLAFTPTQLIVAGVSGNESTIYVSQQNSFVTFTVGTLPSSAFTEPIASPGSRITHLAYYFGKLFWWKDQSFGYATFTNQNDWQLTIVSNQIGTLDNSDAFWNSSGFDSGTKFSGTASANADRSPGGIFFRGQDNHMYVYDGYYLTRLSRVITPTVTTASRRKANSWTQTTQSDFQGGVSTPAANISLTISPGDVTVSSFGVNEYSSTQWNNGTRSNFAVGTSSLNLLIVDGNIPNNGFESGSISNWTGTGSQDTTRVGVNCTMNPRSGSEMLGIGTAAQALNGYTVNFSLWDCNTSVGYSTVTVTQATNSCSWTPHTLSSSGLSGKSVKVNITITISGVTSQLEASDCFVNSGTDMTFYTASDETRTSLPILQSMEVDDVLSGSDTVSSGYYTSKVFDTGFTSSTVQLQANWTISNSSPTFGIYHSTASVGGFASLMTSTNTNSVANRYLFYTTTISYTQGQNALTYISSFSIVARSTGTYYSAVDNAASLTSWSTFGTNDTTPGNSSITYYVRSATGAFAVGSSTVAWVQQTKNSTVNYSTGTYFQMRADFALTAATETPTISDFSFNWFEGNSASQSFMTYFNDAIWFSVSASSSVSTNNRIFYWDLLNGAWLVYDIPSNGFLIENNSLYFGSPTAGQVLKFGGVTTDNGAAINSYWRSKSFLGTDPFVQNEFIQSDFVLGESSTTLTYTYTLDSKTATAYTMTAYDSAASLIQRNFLLPVGKIGKYYDFKVGDNSSAAAWRLMGHRVKYNALNWVPVLR